MLIIAVVNLTAVHAQILALNQIVMVQRVLNYMAVISVYCSTFIAVLTLWIVTERMGSRG